MILIVCRFALMRFCRYGIDLRLPQFCLRKSTHHILTEILRTSSILHQDRGLRMIRHRGLYLKTWDTPEEE